MSVYKLPTKIFSYMDSLKIMYRKNKEMALPHEIISNCRVFLELEIDYDGYNGGTTGHGIRIFIHEGIFEKIINPRHKEKLCEKLLEDLRSLARNSLTNEWIAQLNIEIGNRNDPEYIKSLDPFGNAKIIGYGTDIWQEEYLRCFISHRDTFKIQASELANHLRDFGISSFVAHEDIETAKAWREEIKKALFTMDFMIAFITDDFFESNWTNQEIGAAFGRDILIIPLKLQKAVPNALIDDTQAGNCHSEFLTNNFLKIAEKVYNVLHKNSKYTDQLKAGILRSFISSNTFDKTKKIFEKLKDIKKLDIKEVELIIEAFSKNHNLYGSYYLKDDNNRLTNFLAKHTGKKYQIKDNTLQSHNSLDADIPF